jgi:hypothetical protein
MFFITNAQIIFSANDDNADILTEMFEDMDLEVDTEDDKNCIACMENNYDISSIDEMVDFIRPIIEEYSDTNLNVKGTFLNQSSEEYLDFEIQYKNGTLKVRETDPYVNEVVTDLTYEEYEEEGHHNLSEEDFESHLLGGADGRVVSTRGKFHKWEVID